MLSSGAEAELSSKLQAFHDKTGRQFVVAAFKSLDGESLEDWSNKLFREWKIGDAKSNDGLLFCIYLNDRKWRVEVGYGLEGTITDLQASRVARERGTPLFKAGNYDAGVMAVADGLMAILRGEAQAPPAEEHYDHPIVPVHDSSLGWSDILFILVLLLLFIMPRRRRTFFGGGGWSSDWSGGGGSSDWGGGGGFSGGGGSSGGGGASGGW